MDLTPSEFVHGTPVYGCQNGHMFTGTVRLTHDNGDGTVSVFVDNAYPGRWGWRTIITVTVDGQTGESPFAQFVHLDRRAEQREQQCLPQ